MYLGGQANKDLVESLHCSLVDVVGRDVQSRACAVPVVIDEVFSDETDDVEGKVWSFLRRCCTAKSREGKRMQHPGQETRICLRSVCSVAGFCIANH